MDYWVPIEVWKLILFYVDHVGLACVQLVCKAWNRIYWRHLTALDYSNKRLETTTVQTLTHNVDVASILYLDLSRAHLTTEHLKTFSMLDRLLKLKMADLDFSRIDFNTRSLDYLSRLTNLRHLYLPISSQTSLNTCFLMSLTKLVTLDLGGWRFGREQLRLLALLTRLRSLTLCGCAIEGGFQALTHLEILDLTLLKMTTTNEQTLKQDILSLSHLTNLYELYLRDSCIRSLSTISTLTQLEVLDFDRVTDESASVVSSNLTNLVSLAFHDCEDLSDDGFSRLCGGLPHLEYLTLKLADVSSDGGGGGVGVARLTSLRYLAVKASVLSPDFLREVGNLERLVHVELNTCNLNNQHYSVFSEISENFPGIFRNLHTLILKDDYLFQPAVSLDGLAKLTTLSQLTMKNLHCESLSFLDNLVQLKSFGLVHLHLSPGSTTSNLSNLTNLESLHVTSLNANQSVLEHMTKLQSLTLATCGRLSGFISAIKKLPRLEWLDVSRIYIGESDRILLARALPFVMIHWEKEGK